MQFETHSGHDGYFFVIYPYVCEIYAFADSFRRGDYIVHGQKTVGRTEKHAASVPAAFQ